MKKTIQKGFTLIELLVVIAIIGILAGILFLAINPAEQTRKANDATVKLSLSQLRTQAAVEFVGTNDYSIVCTHSETGALYNAASAVGKIGTVSKCFDDTESFVAAVTTNYGGIFCTDLNGFAGTILEVQFMAISEFNQKCK